MAFDGILVHALVSELNTKFEGGRIVKITQPEPYELLLTIKTQKDQYRLLMSANASLPLLYLTEENQASPLTAPNFCMLLRKHIGTARILSVSQPGLERIVDMTLEHLDELGDLKQKHLIIELMGKYSNIIFTDQEGRILDAIRHVSPTMSSVRTVLPGHPYFIPDTQHKRDALSETPDGFWGLLQEDLSLSDVFLSYTGFSTQSAQEAFLGAGLDPDKRTRDLTASEKGAFVQFFMDFRDRIGGNRFTPCMALKAGKPAAFSALPIYSYPPSDIETFPSVSSLLYTYYREKNQENNIRERALNLRHVAETLLQRASKKQDLQEKQLKDTEKRETMKLYGELLQAYAYSLPQGEKSVRVQNYYTGEEMTIPVDPDLSILDNSRRYYEKYGKQKRTYDALSTLLKETQEEVQHLSSVISAIDLCPDKEALKEIRQEMQDQGYLHKTPVKVKREKIISKPYHYRTPEGFDLYVGKNNLQNDALTFRFAENGDWFFHAKKMPGSHVILKTNRQEIPDKVYEEAAALAAYYSSGRKNPKIDVDYVLKKEVKKPNGAKPGFVVYYTNYSMTVAPSLEGLTLVEKE